jgi:hypothetical protein
MCSAVEQWSEDEKGMVKEDGVNQARRRESEDRLYEQRTLQLIIIFSSLHIHRFSIVPDEAAVHERMQ